MNFVYMNKIIWQAIRDSVCESGGCKTEEGEIFINAKGLII
jgi:hypothetical protein